MTLAPTFSSEELTRAIAIARADALEEAAKLAEADHTPGYGNVSGRNADIIEFIAAKQRTDIASRIRFAALRDFPATAHGSVSRDGGEKP